MRKHVSKTWIERLHAVLTILSTSGMSLLIGPDRKPRQHK